MKTLSLDLETYSDIDIKASGMYKYVQSPNFEIMLCAFSIDGGLVMIMDLMQGQDIEFLLPMLLDPTVEKRAYNAPFEWYCLSKHFKKYLPLGQWVCTMHHGLYCGYPAGLSAIGSAIGLAADKQKMGIGMALIRKFCIPRAPTARDARARILPHHEPEKWNLFKQYCIQDVYTEMAVKSKLEPFAIPVEEHRLWVLDQEINARGVAVDMDLVDGALYCSAAITEELVGEAKALTGLEKPNSVKQLTKWLEEEIGEDVENLQKATVTGMLENMDASKAKRMLEIRQELSKTSVKKYVAMKNAVCLDGRIRGLLQFYGANRTGRWAGRLVQVQNLPRNHMPTLELARDYTKKKDVEALKLIYGNVPDTLSQLIRTAFVPAAGTKFYISDFSAIEARVIAWLAQEQWRLDVFATHGKIYEASASAMFGVPLEKISKGNPEYDLRQKGKIAELALGYGGSKGALITMGALNMGLTEEELPDIVNRWRAANKRIVDFWYRCENAALDLMDSGTPQAVAGCVFSLEHGSGLLFLTIRLPSGRKLYYPKPFLKENRFNRMALNYFGVNQETKKWSEIETYGGKLVENIVQAVARDCLAEALVRVDMAGFATTMHVHDEIIAESSPTEGTMKRMNDILSQPIDWAPGLQLKGDGFETEFYKKD